MSVSLSDRVSASDTNSLPLGLAAYIRATNPVAITVYAEQSFDELQSGDLVYIHGHTDPWQFQQEVVRKLDASGVVEFRDWQLQLEMGEVNQPPCVVAEAPSMFVPSDCHSRVVFAENTPETQDVGLDEGLKELEMSIRNGN